MPVNVWIDVEDLFEYARENIRPSGIQRVAFEICHALHVQDAGTGQVNFVRHAPFTKSFAIVTWQEVEELFVLLTRCAAPPLPAPPAARPPAALRLLARRSLHRLPTRLRVAAIDAAIKTGSAGSAWSRLLREVAGLAARGSRKLKRRAAKLDPRRSFSFAARAAPGDVILVLGSPWFHPDYAGLIRRHRDTHGLRLALLVHDLVPLRRPEWCDRTLPRLFKAWFTPLLPLCDHLFAVSRATAQDLLAYAAERGLDIPQVEPIPIGTGLGAPSPPAPSRDLPPPRSYALIVSTIEIRKNHLLLFRVWRRLLEELPPHQVPTLVFAGRVGWLVDDLMRQIANSRNLDGKLVVVESPTDRELETLYRGCLFTLLPSFHEGWGLPVTESLAFGKPCLISNAASLPEAGGALVRSFDPDNLHDALAVIRDTITDPQGLERWEERVRREFHPVPWSATAAAVLHGLQTPVQEEAPVTGRPARIPVPFRVHEPVAAALQS